MIQQKDSKFIKESGQEMYFDKEMAKRMIEREDNSSHISTSKFFEAILMVEFKGKTNLKIANLAAGAHTMRYAKFIEFLKDSHGKLYWIDQSPFMLNYALQNTPVEFKDTFEYFEKEMVSFLKEKSKEFDGLILQYSFNYLIPCSLEDWLRIMYKSLKKGGKVITNPLFYEQGMWERSHNAVYEIKGQKVIEGHRPKDNEIIEVFFLKNAGDKSVSPETFATTKTIYYSPKYIKDIARRVGFSKIEMYEDWEKNKKWKDSFQKLNPGSESKSKSFLFLQK